MPVASPVRMIAIGLAALNLAGIAWLGWFMASTLIYDGVMVLELTLCVVATATLAGVTWAGWRLHRRGRSGAGITLLALGAMPVAAALGFLLYLEANPIDWR